MWNARLDEAQAGIKPGEISTTSDNADDTTIMAEQRRTKEPLEREVKKLA